MRTNQCVSVPHFHVVQIIRVCNDNIYISAKGEETAWTLWDILHLKLFPNIISPNSLTCLKGWVLFLVTCTVPLSSQSLQFQTIGGISHHHQRRVGGRHLNAARLVLISSRMAVCLWRAVGLRIIVIATIKQRPQTCCLFCHILWGGQVSLRICAASEQKLECEQVKGENEGKSPGTAFLKSSIWTGLHFSDFLSDLFSLNTVEVLVKVAQYA